MSYKKLSKEEWERANRGNVLEFIQKQNIAVTQESSDSYQLVDHDSLKITPSKNAWFWFSQDVGGYGAKSFAEKYILRESNLPENVKSRQAAQMVLDADVSLGSKKIRREAFQFDKTQVSNQFNEAYKYLTETRKIDPVIINRLHKLGLIEQDRQENALFMWQDLHRNRVAGISVQGTNINHNKYGKRGTLKRIEKNSTPHFGWSFDIREKGRVPENIVFCESCIDAISYYNAANKSKGLKSTRIVSMEGLKKKVVLNYIDIQRKQLAGQSNSLKSIKLAVDRDEAGDKFVQEIQELQKEAIIKENEFTQKVIDKNGEDSFAGDISRMQHQDKNGEQYSLANAPKIQSAQPPKNAGVKDWNDFLQKVSNQKIKILKIEQNPKYKRNITFEQNKHNKQNVYKPTLDSEATLLNALQQDGLER